MVFKINLLLQSGPSSWNQLILSDRIQINANNLQITTKIRIDNLARVGRVQAAHPL